MLTGSDNQNNSKEIKRSFEETQIDLATFCPKQDQNKIKTKSKEIKRSFEETQTDQKGKLDFPPTQSNSGLIQNFCPNDLDAQQILGVHFTYSAFTGDKKV